MNEVEDAGDGEELEGGEGELVVDGVGEADAIVGT